MTRLSRVFSDYTVVSMNCGSGKTPDRRALSGNRELSRKVTKCIFVEYAEGNGHRNDVAARSVDKAQSGAGRKTLRPGAAATVFQAGPKTPTKRKSLI